MTKEASKESKFIYEDIADGLALQISKGVYQKGDPVPSIRKLSSDLGVSTKTVEQSYILLESLGLIAAEPKKGFFVRGITNKTLEEPKASNIEIIETTFKEEDLAADLLKSARVEGAILLGPAVPSSEILPGKKLNQIMSSICKSAEPQGIGYEFPPGNFNLRQQISKKSIEWGGRFTPEDLIITNGTSEAVLVALRAVAKPGDTILTESPNSFGILQVITNLGLKTLEIPSSPATGIDMKLTKEALASRNIAACILCPNINNPLGSLMPDENKKEFYKICALKGIPIIEDDAYGELYFGNVRPKPIKAFDEKGIVLYCSSFSKTIAPGYRVGWIYPGKFFEEVNRLKIFTSYATATLNQMAIAEFLRTGGYDRSLRNLRTKYESQLSVVSKYVSEYFPDGTKLSRPQGGFFLWVELPKQINSIELQREAIKKKITIAPGPLFSTHKGYENYIRISCGFPLTPVIKDAIKTLGDIAKKLM